MFQCDDILRLYSRADRLKKARSGSTIDVCKDVMTALKTGTIEMTPRRVFLLQRLAKLGGFAFCTGLAIIALNITLHLLERSGALEFLNLGPTATFLVAPLIPLDFAILFAVAGIAGYFFLRQMSLVTHHSYLRLAVLYGFFILAAGLSFSNTQLYDTALALNPFGRALSDGVQNYYLARAQYQVDENQALIGRVVRADAAGVLVETPKHSMVELAGTQDLLNEPFFMEGQIIKAVGHRDGERFFVSFADTVGKHGQDYFVVPATVSF